MATLKSPPDFVDKLKEALVRELRKSGITAKVTTEPVPATKLYRFLVVAPKFKNLMHSERQDLVWRIAEQAVPRELMRISMILTLENAVKGQ